MKTAQKIQLILLIPSLLVFLPWGILDFFIALLAMLSELLDSHGPSQWNFLSLLSVIPAINLLLLAWLIDESPESVAQTRVQAWLTLIVGTPSVFCVAYIVWSIRFDILGYATNAGVLRSSSSLMVLVLVLGVPTVLGAYNLFLLARAMLSSGDNR